MTDRTTRAKRPRKRKTINDAAADVAAFFGTRAASVGVNKMDGIIYIYVKRKRDLQYVPVQVDGYAVIGRYVGKMSPA